MKDKHRDIRSTRVFNEGSMGEHPSNGQHNSLSERQERLLISYFDGESSWLGNWRAESLLKRNVVARAFLEELDLLGRISRDSFDCRINQVTCDSMGAECKDSQTGSESSLWQRIDLRIQQEERSAVFLGERQEARSSERHKWFDFSVGSSWKDWGVTGAVAATCVIMLTVYVPGLISQSSSRSGDSLASREGAEPEFIRVDRGTTGFLPTVKTVGFNSGSRDGGIGGSKIDSAGQFDRPQIIEDPVEVEWMRSEERLRLIQDADKRTAVIWVRRGDVDPLFRSRPLDRYRRRSRGQNSAPESTNGLQLLDPQVPTAIVVGNK